jgi:hypothetical protein
MISPTIHVRHAHERHVHHPVSLDDAAVSPTYHALRVGNRASLAEWWAQAHARQAHAPTAIRAILAGRTRVELSAEEAACAIDWAVPAARLGERRSHATVRLSAVRREPLSQAPVSL